MKTRNLAQQALIAAAYVVISLAMQPLTFGAIQVRIAELSLLLLLVNKRHATGITLGCFITNLFSPLGVVDIVFGTLATALTCYLMIKTNNDIVKLAIPAIINGLIVGAELTWVFGKIPFLLNAFYVFMGEIIAVFIPGMLLKKQLRKHSVIQEYFG